MDADFVAAADTIQVYVYEHGTRRLTKQAAHLRLARDVLLTSNDRYANRFTRATKAKALRAQAAATARALTPVTSHQRMVIWYTFPDNRRRDPSNLAPTSKSLADGFVDAGILQDDDYTHLIGPDNRLGEPDKTLPAGTVRAFITLETTSDTGEATSLHEVRTEMEHQSL